MAEIQEIVEQAHNAFCKDDAATIRLLLQEHPALKAKINEPLAAFDSPVITSVRSREMLDVLLEAGADINARSRWWAGSFGLLDNASPDLAAYAIERGAIVDAHSAARLGLRAKLQELIEANPELVHARGGDGQTPLHFASTIEIAEYLLDRGADIDARDIDHESTPAQYMVRDRQNVARYLVGRGCKTDLLMAAALGDLERVRKQLELDPASVHMNVSERYFPKQNPRAGGSIYIWTLGQHKTAHLVAREFAHEEIFRLLMDKSPDELKLVVACELGDDELFNSLLAKRPDLVASLSDENARKLADAAQRNNLHAVQLMLAARWPLNVRGQHGATPLHWAAFHGNVEMTEVLLRSHPELEATDTDYQGTPLGWALHGSEQGWYPGKGDYPAVVRLLLKAGAEIPEKIKGTEAVRAALRESASAS